jgi:Transposase DNA-binding/Transposase Tn5 dimerisation domain
MMAPWVEEEMKQVNLRDKRLDRRLRRVLSQLAAHPTASIPAACGGWTETTAAYRLFDNNKVTFRKVLSPHLDRTQARITAQPVALLVADTTEIDVTRPQKQVLGTGPLDGGSRRGVFLHLTHAFTPDGTSLGTTEAMAWAREDEKRANSVLTRGERAAVPIEEKESFRWLLSMQGACEVAQRHPQTQIVFVADSEADIYEVLAETNEQPGSADWIVRSCQDRALVDDEEDRFSLDYLREELLASPVLFERTVQVRGRKAKVACEDRGRRQPRQSRRAVVEVRAARVTLRAPERKKGQLADVLVNAVIISEVKPPDGDVPVEWILLTSLTIDTIESVKLVIDYYCTRWMIEVFFRTLKSGCRAEARRFETMDRFLPCLAIYLIVTWRVLFVCWLGRNCPEMSCETVFETDEWKSVYQVVNRQPPPKKAPKLQEMVRMVAQLGGYLNHKRDHEPGTQTVWLGLQRLHDIATCWRLFGPGTRAPASIGSQAHTCV